MDTRKVKHQYLLSKWTPIIRECRKSGLPVKKWCHENNVDEKQFYYWQRIIREELCVATEVPVKEPLKVFAPLQIQDYHREMPQSITPKHAMVLSIGNYRLELTNQTSPELLETVLKVIQHV